MEQSNQISESFSRPFAFSQFFRSSISTKGGVTPARLTLPRSTEIEKELATFIGYTWGPAADAFSTWEAGNKELLPSVKLTATPRAGENAWLTPGRHFMTPHRANRTIPGTIQRTGTVQRTINGRPLSDKEAMEVLLDVIGMSAQKKVLESGRKPRSMKRLGGFAKKNGPSVPLSLRFQLGKLEIPPGTRRDLNPLREDGDFEYDDDESTVSTLPSPSPTPRPSSAMSTTLTFSRRSLTPTATLSSLRNGLPSNSLAPPDFTSSIQRPRAFSESVASRPSTRESRASTGSAVSFDTQGLEMMEERLAKLRRDIDDIAIGVRTAKSLLQIAS